MLPRYELTQISLMVCFCFFFPQVINIESSIMVYLTTNWIKLFKTAFYFLFLSLSLLDNLKKKNPIANIEDFSCLCVTVLGI